MKLDVAFYTDPTGMGADTKMTIELPSETCLFCCYDKYSSRFQTVVQKAIAEKLGYNNAGDITLLKVYIAKDQ